MNMAKTKTAYVCSECGYDSPKWYGKCPSCGQWNTMVEEILRDDRSAGAASQHLPGVAGGGGKPVRLRDITQDSDVRFSTGIRL